MTNLRVFSTARICSAGLSAASIIAGVQEVIDPTRRGVRDGRALHNGEKV